MIRFASQLSRYAAVNVSRSIVNSDRSNPPLAISGEAFPRNAARLLNPSFPNILATFIAIAKVFPGCHLFFSLVPVGCVRDPSASCRTTMACCGFRLVRVRLFLRLLIFGFLHNNIFPHVSLGKGYKESPAVRAIIPICRAYFFSVIISHVFFVHKRRTAKNSEIRPKKLFSPINFFTVHRSRAASTINAHNNHTIPSPCRKGADPRTFAHSRKKIQE